MCVGVLCSVLILLIVYGAVVACRAVGSEVHADTVRLMEQMIALDQLANQYNNSQQTSDLQTGRLWALFFLIPFIQYKIK